MTKRICFICDEVYEDTPERTAVHEHLEPQSGPYRKAWLDSGLPYAHWVRDTPEGREWEAWRNARDKNTSI